ncbi:MAG: hypothetical protein E7137_03330 [Rikenellaceae bacterium]|nr:hypothetical protein [Rikenellaceae bacterium]
MEIQNNPNKLIRVIFTPIIWITKFIGRNCPEFLMKIRYFVRFKKRLNLENPKTLNEKILYMSLRTDTTLWTRLADKYNVRGYVEECGLSDILVPLLGHWEKAEEIDFMQLPDSFVFKTVQGSGDIILVKDKSQIIKEEIRKQLEISVNTVYGDLEGGKHYMRIKPAIIAEELMKNDEVSEKYSTSIIDYKIWCFNGKAHYIWACCNRDHQGTDVMTYDLNWSALPEYSVFNEHYREGNVLPKPQNFERMVEVAEKLAKPFPVVRVDLYNLAGKIYFGEMTFTSLGGLMDFYTDDFQHLAGSLIDINYKG